MSERAIVATVTQMHGAYLVSWEHGEYGADTPAIELYSAASSLVKAKRVAVEGARMIGCEGAVRWEKVSYGWELTMTEPDTEGSY